MQPPDYTTASPTDTNTTQCTGCGRYYDKRRYAASRFYCSAQCKHSKGFTKPFKKYKSGRKGGRPRKYPRGTVGLKLEVMEKLREIGVLIRDAKPANGADETNNLRFLVYIPSWNVWARAIAGGSNVDEKWADLVFYKIRRYPRRLYYQYACAKERRSVWAPGKGDKPRRETRRFPCKQYEKCRKCRHAHVFERHFLLDNDDAIRADYRRHEDYYYDLTPTWDRGTILT